MKATTTLCLAFTALLTACNSSDDTLSQMALSKERIALAWPMQQDTVLILSPAQTYSIRSSDETVATAVIKGDTLFVTAQDFGMATIEVSSNRNTKIELPVQVYGFKTGAWWGSTYVTLEEGVSIEDIIDGTVVIDPNDCTTIQGDVSDDIQQQIKADIKQKYKWFPGRDLTFDSENRTFEYSGGFGTYTLKNRTISFEYYRKEGMEPLVFEGFEPVLPVHGKEILMKVNSTDTYKQMFPDAGITEVVTQFGFFPTPSY